MVKGIEKRIRTSTYGSPEHASDPEHLYGKKSYPDVGAGLGVIYGQSVDPGSQGGQALYQNPYYEEGVTGVDPSALPPALQNRDGLVALDRVELDWYAGKDIPPTPTSRTAIENPRFQAPVQDPSKQEGMAPIQGPYVATRGQRGDIKPPGPTMVINPGDGAGTRDMPQGASAPYPVNPALEGNLGIERGPYTSPKRQVQGDPNAFAPGGPYDSSRNEAGPSNIPMPPARSVTIPGQQRTPVGDKWDFNQDYRQYRQGGRDYMQNIPDHWDMLDRTLGARGFIRNDLSLNLDRRKYEQKETGDYVLAHPDGNNFIQCDAFDRTGAQHANLNTFSGLDSLLGQSYPNGDVQGPRGRVESIGATKGFYTDDTHEHFAGEFPQSAKVGPALSAIEQKLGQGHSGATVFLNQNSGTAIDATTDKAQWAGAVANYPPDSYIVARTNYSLDQAKADPGVKQLVNETRDNPNVHDYTVGAWTGNDGKVYVDYGAVVSGRENAMGLARKWGQQGIFGADANYYPTEKQEPQAGGLARMEGRQPTSGAGTHEHYPGEFGGARAAAVPAVAGAGLAGIMGAAMLQPHSSTPSLPAGMHGLPGQAPGPRPPGFVPPSMRLAPYQPTPGMGPPRQVPGYPGQYIMPAARPGMAQPFYPGQMVPMSRTGFTGKPPAQPGITQPGTQQRGGHGEEAMPTFPEMGSSEELKAVPKDRPDGEGLSPTGTIERYAQGQARYKSLERVFYRKVGLAFYAGPREIDVKKKAVVDNEQTTKGRSV